MDMDPEFTGDKLHKLVLDIESAVGENLAGMTPLGMAVMRLCESAAEIERLKAEVESVHYQVEDIQGQST